MEKYHILKKVGEGAHGVVFKAKWIKSDNATEKKEKKVALKKNSSTKIRRWISCEYSSRNTCV
jgi:serine/threonine protein kinase